MGKVTAPAMLASDYRLLGLTECGIISVKAAKDKYHVRDLRYVE